MKLVRLYRWVTAASLACAAAGCGDGSSSLPVKISGGPPPLLEDVPGEVHAHATRGPHDGELLELGKGNYHLELVRDAASQTVTIYVLDATATNTVSIAAEAIQLNLVLAGKPTQFVLPPAAQPTDPEGVSSCFALRDERLCAALTANNAKGRIVLAVDERPYSAELRRNVQR